MDISAKIFRMNRFLKIIVIPAICICAAITLVVSITWGISTSEQKEQELYEELNNGAFQFTVSFNNETLALDPLFHGDDIW